MADDVSKVIISGLSGSVPKWATEGTLREIQEEILKIVNVIDKKTKVKALKIKEDQEQLDEHTQKLKELDKEQTKHQKNLKVWWKETGDAYSATTDHLERIRSSASSGFTSLTALSGIAQGLGGVFSNLLSPVGLIGSSFALGGLAIKLFVDYLTHTSQALLGLYDSGITFTNSLGDLRHAAALAGQPLDEFATLLVKNSAVIKALGSDGAIAFGNIAKSTRELIKVNGYFGLSMQGINEYTVDYLEQLRKQGVLGRMTDQQRSAAAAEYIGQLTAYSQILGKSREQIDNEIKQAKKSPGVQSILATMSKESQVVYQNLVGQISGTFGDAAPQVIDAFNEMFKGPLGQTTEFAKALQTTSPELYRQLYSLANAARHGAISTETGSKELGAFSQGVQNLSDQQHTTIANMILYNKSISEGATGLEAAAAAVQGAKFDQLGKVVAQAPDQFSASMLAITMTIKEIEMKFADVFAGFIQTHQKFLDMIVSNLSKAADWILHSIEDLMNPESRAKILANLSSGMTTLISGLLDMISDMISVKLGISTPEEIERKNQKKASGSYDSIDEWNDKSFLGKGATMLGRGMSAVGSGIWAAAEAPADVGSWAGSEIGAGINYLRGKPTPLATPAAQPKPMPDMPSPTLVAPSGNSPSDNLDKAVDLLEQIKDHAAMNNALTKKGNDINSDIKNNTSNNSNIIR